MKEREYGGGDWWEEWRFRGERRGWGFWRSKWGWVWMSLSLSTKSNTMMLLAAPSSSSFALAPFLLQRLVSAFFVFVTDFFKFGRDLDVNGVVWINTVMEFISFLIFIEILNQTMSHFIYWKYINSFNRLILIVYIVIDFKYYDLKFTKYII